MDKLARKRSPLENTLKIGGSFVCFCVGSGFATGQDILQYFCVFGTPAIFGFIVAILLYGYITVSALKVGYEQKFENPMDILDYYCGKYIGKFFRWAAIPYYFMSTSVMIAGFGAALNQHFGVPSAIGNILLGVVCVLTVLLGLRGLVDVIGSLGPIIVILAVAVGGTYLALNADSLVEGMKLAPTITSVPKLGPNWFIGGIFYASWAPMLLTPFLAPLSSTATSKKQAVWGGIWGAVGVGIATILMILALFCDYQSASGLMIPSLDLASQLSPIFVVAVLCILFFGIYSSSVPNFFVLAATFFKEKTLGYNLFTIIAGFIAVGATFVLPFNTLLNIVFTIFGYVGILFTVLMIVKDIRTYIERKNIR